MGGLLTRLVSMRAQQDLAAKQGPLDVAKLVLTSEDATPEAREWAINSVAELADGISGGGKGKGKGGAGGTGAGGGLGSIFKTVLSNLNPYRAGPQTRQEVKDVQGARPQRMFLTEDEKAQVKQKQEEAENKILLEQKAKEARQTAQINREENQKNYEQEFDRGVKTLNLSPADAAKRADDIVNKYREPTERAAGSTGTPKTVFGIVKGQEGEGRQMLFINPRDPAGGFMDANGQKYTKDEVSDISTTVPSPQRLFGRPLEISQYVQSKGYAIGTPEYDHWFGVIAGADLQASIGRQQQAGAIAGYESGIPLGQGFPAIPEKKKEEGGAPTTPGAAPAVKPPLSSRAAPAATAPAAAVSAAASAPADDRFQSMYLASLMSDAPAAGGAARVGIIRGRESFKKILGLSAADFSMIEAANKDQRKGLADTIQRAVATQRVNDILSSFGDEVIKRAKNVLNTGSPLLNQPIRNIQVQSVGNEDIRRFLVSLNAFQRQYGILTSGSPQSRAQIPVSVGEKVDKIIDPNATLSEVISTVDQVKIEGKQEAQGFKNAAKETIDSISGSLKPKQPLPKPRARGQRLSTDQAKQYLDANNGDKEAARAAAKADGWSF